MFEEQPSQTDPQLPAGQEEQAGQGGEGQEGSAAASQEQEEPLAERLERLEKSYGEAQKLIGRQGRELGELRKKATAPPEEASVNPNSFFEDPVTATRQVVTSALSEFEQRQERRRQAERMMGELAKERNVPESRLNEINEQVQTAISSGDVEAYLDIIGRLAASDDVSAQVQQAAQVAKDTAQRNARAVTAESGHTHTSPPAKPVEEMTLAEMREHIVRTEGIAPPEY